MTRAVIVGGGVGGLAAALALRQAGLEVTLCEATGSLGGLAQAFVDQATGTRFDGGPYVLLDPAGLRWAFTQLGLSLESLGLQRVDDFYSVEREGGPTLRITADLEQTAAQFERAVAGQGARYRAFVAQTVSVHQALAPMQLRPDPGPWALLRSGAIGQAPFLLRTLKQVFDRAGLHPLVQDALGIWTTVAGQRLDEAPSPLALVPALLHTEGCYVPRGGVGAVVEAVEGALRSAGVTVRLGARVERIQTERRRVAGVRLSTGEVLPAHLVVSDASGVATLLELAPTGARTRAAVAALPLQSPGVAAYGLATQPPSGPYLRFRASPDDLAAPCRLLVRPTLLPNAQGGARYATRVVAPLSHEEATRLGEAGQEAFLERVLAEPFVRESLGRFEVLRRRVPATWGRAHTLHRDSMNPVMTAKFMRAGRLPHQVAEVNGLFLVGSSTHPGQWVSFCLISGVLGARAALRWLGRQRSSSGP